MQDSGTNTTTIPSAPGLDKRHSAETDEEKRDNLAAKHVEANTGSGEKHLEADAKSTRSHDKTAVVHGVAVDGRASISDEKAGDKPAEEDDDDESKYLSGFKLAILSLGLCLTTFVIALDNTIIATAIPKITSVFNSLEDVGWVRSPRYKLFASWRSKNTRDLSATTA